MGQRKLPLIWVGLALIAFLSLAGCGSTMMQMRAREVPQPHQAEVIFVRPTSYGGAIQFGVWDGENFVGIVSANASVQYLTAPGEHLFLAVAENRSYIKANLAAGKRYIVVARPFMGVWKARVALDPVRKGDKVSDRDIATWMERLSQQSVIPEKVEGYVLPRKADIAAAIRAFDPARTKFGVLEPEDAR